MTHPTQEGITLMASLALVAPLPVEDTRVRKPNRRPQSCPTNVAQFPVPDPDIPAAARYLTRQGWSWLDAAHAGLDMDLAAAMLMIESPPS